MTERATISVVPCPAHKLCDQFHIVIDKAPYMENDRMWGSTSESEANAKKQELEMAESKAGERQKFGGCLKCGQAQTKNPHPEAGKMDTLLTIGAIWECIPCLVANRHEWCRRALQAEGVLREIIERTEREASEINSRLASTPAQAPSRPCQDCNTLLRLLLNLQIGGRTLFESDAAIVNEIEIRCRTAAQPQAVATRPVCKCGHTDLSHATDLKGDDFCCEALEENCPCPKFEAVAPEPSDILTPEEARRCGLPVAEGATEVRLYGAKRSAVAPPEGREPIKTFIEHLQWMMSHGDERVKQTDGELKAFNIGRVDCLQSIFESKEFKALAHNGDAK